jgi:hypothetical protein
MDNVQNCDSYMFVTVCNTDLPPRNTRGVVSATRRYILTADHRTWSYIMNTDCLFFFAYMQVAIRFFRWKKENLLK